MPILGLHPAAVPRAVIFDIGRVIIPINLSRLSRVFAEFGSGNGLSPDAAFQALVEDPCWEDWQTGRMTPSSFHSHVTRRFGLTLNLEQFRVAWNGLLEPVTLLNEPLFQALASKCRLAVLSNTDPIHVAHMEASYSFFRHFPVRIYSCRAGTSKPSREIYQLALRAVGVSPEQAMYIDDVREYAEAAQQLGITGFHFTSPAELHAELARLTLLPRQFETA